MTPVTSELQYEHEIILRGLKLLDAIASGAADADLAARAAELLARYVDGCHHRKEEAALFPALRRVLDDESSGVGRALEEHEEARRLLAEMRSAMASGDRAALSRAAAQLSSLLRSHVDFEESLVFANAEALLDEEEKASVLRAYSGFEGICRGFEELGASGEG